MDQQFKVFDTWTKKLVELITTNSTYKELIASERQQQIKLNEGGGRNRTSEATPFKVWINWGKDSIQQ